MVTDCVLGIDIGTTAVKGILATPAGEIVATSAVQNDLISLKAGWAEEDPEQWWRNTGQVCRQLLAAVPDANILAVGVSGMVPTIVLLDADGQPLRLSIQQNDARAAAEVAYFQSQTDAETILRLTGSAVTQQSVGPKLLWLWLHEPEVMKRTRRVMGSYDYINYKLTGVHAHGSNWALESGLYNAVTQTWLLDLLELSRVPLAWLGDVCQPRTVIGRVTAAAAAHTGMKAGTPVVAGSADHVASAFSAGLKTRGDLLIKLGGAGDILFVLDEFKPDARLFIDYHVVPGKFLINGCMAASGSILKWFQRELGAQRDFADLDAASAKIRPGSDGLIMLPYFLGEKTPIFDPAARGVLFGLTLRHTQAHIFRAALEAVSFGFLHHIRVLEDIGLRPNPRAIVTNGGANSRLWRQITADVLGMELVLFANHPGSSLGAMFVAGMGAGVFTDWAEIDRFITAEGRTVPDMAHHEVYRRLYSLYREIYETTKHLFPQIAVFDD